MKIPSFEEIKKITNSRYELVMLVSKRARKLVDGQPSLIELGDEKPVTTAMEEILSGKIIFGESMTDRQYAQKIEMERVELMEKMKSEMIKSESVEEE